MQCLPSDAIKCITKLKHNDIQDSWTFHLCITELQLIFTSPYPMEPEDGKETMDKKFPTYKSLWTSTFLLTLNQII